MIRELSQKENERVTEEVLRYHGLAEGKKKEELRKKLIERTEILIYLVPIERGYLWREEAGGFYLEQRKNARAILDSYFVSHLLYNDYISQVLRPRCVNYMIKVRKDDGERSRIHYEEGRKDIEAQIECHESCPIYDEKEEGEKERPKLRKEERDALRKIEKMDLSGLTDYVIKKDTRKSRAEALTEAEATVMRMLDSEKKRAELVYLILYIRHQDMSHLAGHLAAVLAVPREAIERMIELKDRETDCDEERIEKDREVASRHFRQLLRYESLWLAESDPEEKDKILISSRRLRTALSNRLSSIEKEMRGMTQREIASKLHVSRSLVSLNIKRGLEMLEQAEKETRLRED